MWTPGTPRRVCIPYGPLDNPERHADLSTPGHPYSCSCSSKQQIKHKARWRTVDGAVPS
jgi:hypothetical protein